MFQNRKEAEAAAIANKQFALKTAIYFASRDSMIRGNGRS
jgi:hypothetical protein